MAEQRIPSNTFGTAKFIVDSDASQGNYTTISAALTAATSGSTIFIRPGTYIENLTLKAGVNLTAFVCDAKSANVVIVGKCTATFAGTSEITGVQLKTNSDYFLEVTGSSATIVNLFYCDLNANDFSGIHCTNTSATISARFNTGNLATTGIAYFVGTGGTLNFTYSVLSNTGSSTTASTMSAGSVNINYCSFRNAVTTSGTSGLTISYTIMQVGFPVTAVTMGGSGSNLIEFCDIQSGSSSAISISAGGTNLVLNSRIDSSNTNAITGAGSINYSNLIFPNSASINVTTQTGGVAVGGVAQAPSAGYIGEQIRATIASGSAVTLTSPTAANVTSISLTAGIWDVSGVVQFTGATTGTICAASINTTSATLGTSGDNNVSFPFLTQASTDLGITIPSYRLTLTATTTVYLVAQSTFTVGTGKAYGRISGTRVG